MKKLLINYLLVFLLVLISLNFVSALTGWSYSNTISVTNPNPIGTNIDVNNWYYVDVNSISLVDCNRVQDSIDWNTIRITYNSTSENIIPFYPTDHNDNVFDTNLMERVYFQIQSQITGGATDNSYTLYCKNPTASHFGINDSNIGDGNSFETFDSQTTGAMPSQWNKGYDGGSSASVVSVSNFGYIGKALLRVDNASDNVAKSFTNDVNVCISYLGNKFNDTTALVTLIYNNAGAGFGASYGVNPLDAPTYNQEYFYNTNTGKVTTPKIIDKNQWHLYKACLSGDSNQATYYLDGNIWANKVNTVNMAMNSFDRFVLGFFGAGQFIGEYFDEIIINRGIGVNSLEPTIILAPPAILVSFSKNPSTPTPLDPEMGITTSIMSFTDTTTYSTQGYKNSWWKMDSNYFSTDTNIATFTFTTYGTHDLNRIVLGTDDINYFKTESFSVNQYPQDLNFTWSPANPKYNQSITFYGSATDDSNVIADWNWQFGSDGNSIGQTPSHTFTTVGTRIVCMSAIDGNGLSKTGCRNVSIYGDLNLHIRDENTDAGLNPVVTFNGTNYTSSDGNYSIDLNGITTGTYSVTTNLLNYSTRTFTFDLNQFSQVDANVLLLQSSKSQVIDFKFYKPDDTSLLANAYVTVLDSNGWYAGRIKLDSLGEGTFTLQPFDKNYWFDINAIDGNNYTYTPVKAITKIPLAESDGTTQILTFNINISGNNGAKLDQNLTVDKNILIYSNTKEPYSFTIDSNQTQYFARTYLIQPKGDDVNFVLQPYLVSSTEGIQTVMTLFDIDTLYTLNGIVVTVKKSLPSGLTEVQSGISDSAGTVTFSFIQEETYFIDFNSGTKLITTKELRPISSTLFVYLKTSLISIDPTFNQLSFIFIPDLNVAGTYNWIVNGVNKYYTIGAILQNQQGLIVKTYCVTVKQKGLTIAGTPFCSLGAITSSQVNLDANLFDTIYPVFLTITAQDFSDKNYSFQKTFFVRKGAINWDASNGIFKVLAETTFGKGASILIAVLISLIIVGFFALKIGFDNQALAIVGMVCLGVFALIGFIDLTMYGLACVSVLAAYILYSLTRRT